MPEDLERYWKVVRPRRHREIDVPAPIVPSPDQPMSNSSTLLREEAYVRVQGVNPDGTPSLYNDIERRVQEGIREMLGNGVRVDQGYVDHLRNSLLMEIEESTRSAPDPDPQRSWGPQEESLRMHTQVEENYLWYQSQGINMSRATLQGIYRDNGGLRMDFSQSRAEEERLQREAVLTREEQRRILETVANPPPSYEDMGRRSETLLRLTTLFNELGVSCTVINNQGVQGQAVELQLNLSHGTPGASIGCWISSDGVVHLNLGYPYR